MIIFITSAVILTLIAVVFIVPALLKKNHPFSDEYDDLNVAIAKDRLKEIKQQLEAGEINQQTYQQLHDELESTLALDLSAVPQKTEQAVKEKNRLMPITLAITVPLLAAGIYSQLGDFNAATGKLVESTVIPGDKNRPKMSIEEAVAMLEQRLAEQPENPDGWFMLAKTYMSMHQYQKAVAAYEKTIELVGDEPELLLRYVDALAMTEDGSLIGSARPVIEKVILMIPDNPMLLWMAGTFEHQQKNYSGALAYWYKLRPKITEDTQSKEQLEQLIQEAESHFNANEIAALQQALPAIEKPVTEKKLVETGVEIKVSVELDPALRDKVTADDTLFIFAKALQGPPMPLAAIKKTVSALPLTVSLNDAMAMMPQMKLSNFEQVRIVAVISKSGRPGTQPGDLFAEASPVNVKSQEKISLIINQVK